MFNRIRNFCHLFDRMVAKSECQNTMRKVCNNIFLSFILCSIQL